MEDYMIKIARYRKMVMAQDKATPSPVVENNKTFVSYPDSLSWARSMRDWLTWTQVLDVWERNPGRTHTEREVAEEYHGSPSCLHFVGFRGDEFTRAVKVFGRPDFVHRVNDRRLRDGGELAPHDTVVFANGYESKPTDWSFDDSGVQIDMYDPPEI
jgi:hypothetical protein